MSAARPLDRLRQLAGRHPYRAVAENTYRPKVADDAGAWKRARTLMLPLLADDLDRPGHDDDHSRISSRRSALANFAYSAALAHPGRLNADELLKSERIAAWRDNDPRLRKGSRRSAAAAASAVRSYTDQPERNRRTRAEQPALTTDSQLDTALAVIAGMRSATLRTRALALIGQARGAGMNPTDLRYNTGAAIQTIAGAGIWVHSAAPGRKRAVPCLARFGPTLAEIAVGRDDITLITMSAGVARGDSPSSVTGQISRALAKAGLDFTISAEALRAAWLVEQLEANVPPNTLIRMAGLKTLRALDELIARHGPQPPDSVTALAWELGGIDHDNDESR